MMDDNNIEQTEDGIYKASFRNMVSGEITEIDTPARMSITFNDDAPVENDTGNVYAKFSLGLQEIGSFELRVDSMDSELERVLIGSHACRLCQKLRDWILSLPALWKRDT